jgi:hypothetical protein
MSAKKPILNYAEVEQQSSTKVSQEIKDSNMQQRMTCRNNEIVALVSDDLRAVSTKTNEVIRYSSDTVRRTTKMIAYSREAIAQSRTLIAGRVSWSYELGSQATADLDESALGDRDASLITRRRDL